MVKQISKTEMRTELLTYTKKKKPHQRSSFEHISVMAPPPKTRATEHIGPQTWATTTARSKIRLEIAWLASSPRPSSLESSPWRATAASPLRPQGISILYFSLFFSISLSHLNLTSLTLLIAVLWSESDWVRAELSLSFSLNWNEILFISLFLYV